MARDLTSGFITEIDSSALRPALFASFAYDSGTIYAWTGVGSKVMNGNTYQGLGNLVSVGAVEESQVLKATGIQLSLNGVNSANISLALSEPYQGRRVEIYYAVLDASLNIIADPYLFFAGKMDVMEINDNPQSGSATILMTVENELISLFRARNRYYSAEDQKIVYPNDTGLDYISTIQDVEIVWKQKQ